MTIVERVGNGDWDVGQGSKVLCVLPGHGVPILVWLDSGSTVMEKYRVYILQGGSPVSPSWTYIGSYAVTDRTTVPNHIFMEKL